MRRDWRLLSAGAGLIPGIAVLQAAMLDPHGADRLRVFGFYWAAGDAAWRGPNPFLPYLLTWRTGFGIAALHLKPPTLLPLFQAFALFAPKPPARAWVMGSAVLALGVLTALLAGHWRPAVWAAAVIVAAIGAARS